MDILEPERCNLAEKDINPKTELCVGKRLRKPIMAIYDKAGHSKGYEMVGLTKKEYYDFVGYQV